MDLQAGHILAPGKALYQVKLINFSGKAGNLDIAALDQNFNAGAMGAFVVPNKGDGSGTFDLTKASEPVNNYIISDIVPGDYNSDGKQDLTLLTKDNTAQAPLSPILPASCCFPAMATTPSERPHW